MCYAILNAQYFGNQIEFSVSTSSPSLPDVILLGSVVLQQLNEVVLVIIIHDVCLVEILTRCSICYIREIIIFIVLELVIIL